MAETERTRSRERERPTESPYELAVQYDRARFERQMVGRGTKSGKHGHQGGLVIYVIDGTGYSVINGERVDWEKAISSCYP